MKQRYELEKQYELRTIRIFDTDAATTVKLDKQIKEKGNGLGSPNKVLL